jgi:hypothetical protein
MTWEKHLLSGNQAFMGIGALQMTPKNCGRNPLFDLEIRCSIQLSYGCLGLRFHPQDCLYAAV